MDILVWIFFIILCGSAFTLRGIWGHNLGGAVMGILVGLGLTIIFDLPLTLSIEMTFWLAFTWALGAFIGWARHKTIQRFFRGYIFYGLIPSIVIANYLFSGNLQAQISLILFGPLGMGIGFGTSYKLLDFLRNKLKKSYLKKNPKGKNICWGDRPLEPGEISHIFIFKLDTWKIFLEIISGMLFGITTLIIFNIFPISLKILPSTLNGWNYFMVLICHILVPMGLVLAIIEEKGIIHGWKLPEEQKILSKSTIKISVIIDICLTVIYGIIFIFLFDIIMTPIILFLIVYWQINIFAKFYNPLEAILFKTDCILDISIGVIISIIVFLI